MSEYQFYEWQAIDRILTHEEQVEVEGLSSHIDVPAHQKKLDGWVGAMERPSVISSLNSKSPSQMHD